MKDLVSEPKVESDVVRGRHPNSNFASTCMYIDECVYTHIDTAHTCKNHTEAHPYICTYTKETIRGPDISADVLKNKTKTKPGPSHRADINELDTAVLGVAELKSRLSLELGQFLGRDH